MGLAGRKMSVRTPKPTIARKLALLLACVLLLALVFAGHSSTSRMPRGGGARPVPLPSATTWPQYRGTPQQVGIAPGKMASRLKVAWKFKTGGGGTSSPVVAGGRGFVGSGG